MLNTDFMAGEIEEPMNFESSSFHTGSISFGRFDVDSLAWERRSSFSHNRYLEEAEKYSTPGSVTQRKAYFEAHFKKKALMREASESQNGTEYQTSDNEILDDNNYMEDFAQYDDSRDGPNDHEECETVRCGREDEGCGREDEGCGRENERRGREDEAICPESLTEINVTIGHEECETMKADREDKRCRNKELRCVREDEENPSESQIETAITIGEVFASTSEHVDSGENHEGQINCDLQVAVKDEPVVDVKEVLDDAAESHDGLPKQNDSMPKCARSGKNHATSTLKSEKKSRKIRTTEESSTVKPNLRTHISSAEGARKSSNEVSKDSISIARRTKGESPQKRTEKLSRQKVPLNTCGVSKNLKPVDPECLKTKESQENISRRDQRAKSAGAVTQSSASDKGEPRRRQISNRPKLMSSSSKQDTKINGPIFSLKSDERAEKRKEFYMKLEEKMHAKEAVMNQIQAKTQEEIDSEIKQLRRSLNFKATPMPSFYHEAVPRGSDAKKASTQAKTTKLRSNSASPDSRAAAKSSSKCGYKQGIPIGESVRPPAKPQTLEETKCVPEMESSSSVPTTRKTCTPEAGKRADSAGKKCRDKGKESIVQKQQGSPERNSRVRKGEKVDERRTGWNISKNEMLRKIRKDMAVVGGSGMEHLSVNVAY